MLHLLLEIALFKILLLETWYGLSDREVEERIDSRNDGELPRFLLVLYLGAIF